MKKIIAVAIVTALVSSVFAAENAANKPEPASRYAQEYNGSWPSVVALGEWPNAPVVTGLRLTIPFSTRQEVVTGFDLGFWGACRDFEGLQVNILRNLAKDTLAGFQVGLVNSANRADLFCVQAGLINDAQSMRGFQAGLVNTTGDAEGFMLGIVNVAETLHGYQVGLINVIRSSEVPMFPVVNIGF